MVQFEPWNTYGSRTGTYYIVATNFFNVFYFTVKNLKFLFEMMNFRDTKMRIYTCTVNNKHSTYQLFRTQTKSNYRGPQSLNLTIDN